ncbi:hypothetical protein ACOME3_001350 [Neoechinorhynchus agilis]
MLTIPATTHFKLPANQFSQLAWPVVYQLPHNVIIPVVETQNVPSLISSFHQGRPEDEIQSHVLVNDVFNEYSEEEDLNEDIETQSTNSYQATQQLFQDEDKEPKLQLSLNIDDIPNMIDSQHEDEGVSH